MCRVIYWIVLGYWEKSSDRWSVGYVIGYYEIGYCWGDGCWKWVVDYLVIGKIRCIGFIGLSWFGNVY